MMGNDKSIFSYLFYFTPYRKDVAVSFFVMIFCVVFPVSAYCGVFDEEQWEFFSPRAQYDDGVINKKVKVEFDNYVYIIKESCFACRVHYRTKVYVVDGKVVKAVPTDILLNEDQSIDFNQYQTIGQLMLTISEYVAENPDFYTVRRNYKYGYPEEFSVDPSFEYLDDEYSFEIEKFSFIRKKSMKKK